MKRFTFDFETTQETDEHGTVTIHAVGNGWYTPATMYDRNGDPGDDAEGDVTFTTIEAWDWEDKPLPNFQPDKEALVEEAYARA